MNELVFLKNETALTDSLTVAKMFGKRHDNVLQQVHYKQIYRDCKDRLETVKGWLGAKN